MSSHILMSEEIKDNKIWLQKLQQRSNISLMKGDDGA